MYSPAESIGQKLLRFLRQLFIFRLMQAVASSSQACPRASYFGIFVANFLAIFVTVFVEIAPRRLRFRRTFAEKHFIPHLVPHFVESSRVPAFPTPAVSTPGRSLTHYPALLRLTLLLLSLLTLPIPFFSAEPISDAEYRRGVLGIWEDDYQGHRTLTIRPDGTATMVVMLKGWKASLYASRLQFEMTWSIQGGHLKKRTTSGQPAGKVKTILAMMGDRVDEPILELTADRLLLLDQNGKKRYDWRRVLPED